LLRPFSAKKAFLKKLILVKKAVKADDGEGVPTPGRYLMVKCKP
jgi:hypothetical protein